MVSRAAVGAHYGLRDWLAQRITAIVMAIYTLLLLYALARMPQVDFVAWRLLFAPQWMKLATLLFVVALCWHAWVGVRNIFMDYVKNGAVRLTLHAMAIAWLIACGAWALQILWRI